MLMSPKYTTKYLHNYSKTTGSCYVGVLDLIDIHHRKGYGETVLYVERSINLIF